MTSESTHEERLRETLDLLAAQVQPAPDAYRRARAEWKRRERRRRLTLASLMVVVFTLAVLIGLWALNRTPDGPPGGETTGRYHHSSWHSP
ncbi:hypothetical protein [Thermobispora bispora]|uniref:DUF3040 domain-containing protein n=1 Tax=Thermobispora bispora (strain ATCC 19993 / DSM 43833 / CBS 139.67 / JCM 10125 / KCTC 9307 / NBRC 14880 / R51) TaxID=469371 RepID=D6YAR6_THEBD|nr:hypothetical protein [Thermobispora bispora]ADG88283.1 hypothetical protein Tbis_1568 [Thermobispora bispora DSM 43833]